MKSHPNTSPVPYGPRWLEVSAHISCWLGISGLIFLIAYGAWAEPLKGKSGFLPGAKSFNSFGNSAHPSKGPGGNSNNPFGNAAHPSKGPAGSPFDDDDDNDDEDDEDDDDDNDDAFSMPTIKSDHQGPGSSPSHRPPPKTLSAGGTPNVGPTIARDSEGKISIGGSSANGVTSGKNAPASVKVDEETGEGSKDIVTDFNFPDADILDIAKALGKLTGKNFILDKDVKGRITIISNSPITVGEAWKVFLTALDINGFAIVPSGKFLRIARQRDARDKQLKTYTGDFSPDTDALITRVFPLSYISAEEVTRTFRSFIPPNARIVPYEQTNTVIVTDTGSNIAKLGKMLEILDVEGFDAGIEVVPVKIASAAELSKLIDALIPGTSAGSPGSPGGAPRFGGGKFNARRTKEGGIINTIIADERTNTLIVHANTKGANQVRELVAKLDQKMPLSTGGGKVHVVYLQFADAEQISTTLSNFSGGASKGGGGGGGGLGGPPGGGSGINPMTTSLFEGSIKISPDKATNSLVITASPSDFVTIQRVINRLDIPREQVFVEVVIMEVAINRNFDFSANILSAPSMIGSMPNNDLMGVLTSPLAATGGLIGFPLGNPAPIPGPNNTSIPGSSVMGLIKMLQKDSNNNILATPQIIALDNSEATFESAEKIPVASSTLVQGVGAQQTITKESVALSIAIKPQINKITNFVKMEVTAKMGDIQSTNVPTALQSQAFGSIERTAKTTVVVGDADTIVLGGLIRDKITDTVSKIPILGDIPLLGWLFKAKNTANQKNNLLIFMTPHIIRQYDKIRAILDKKLKERDDFIESSAGGDDKLRDKRDDIIRSLPDIKELTEKKPVTTITIDEDKATETPPAAVPVPPGTDKGIDKNSPPALNPEERTGVPPVPHEPPAPTSMSPDLRGPEGGAHLPPSLGLPSEPPPTAPPAESTSFENPPLPRPIGT